MNTPEERRCIVCGRQVPKRTVDIMVRPETGNYLGWREPNITADLRDMKACQQHTNYKIVSIKKNREGFVTRFTTWDGESYRFQGYFCTNACAIRQGYAAAYHGHRFIWKD